MENTFSSPATNFIIVGSKEGIFFDTNSLQPYIAIQGAENKPMFTGALSNPCHGNNNVITNGEVFMCEGSPISATQMNIPGVMPEISLMKKQCPLEMSIKAADLDTEFTNNCFFVQDSSGQFIQLIGDRALLNSTHNGQQFINVPRFLAPNNSISPAPYSLDNSGEEITQDNIKDIEMLSDENPDNISEVPEIDSSTNNNLENDYDLQESPKEILNPKNLTKVVEIVENPEINHKEMSHCKDTSDIISLMPETVTSHNMNEEAEKRKAVPLLLKIRKVKQKVKKSKKVKCSNEEEWESVKPARKKRKKLKSDEDFSDWSSSDDEILSSRCRRLYENVDPVVKCCPRVCNKKIQQIQQDTAYASFTDLEKLGQGDRYLGNCVHLNITSPMPRETINDDDDFEPPSSPWPNYDEISQEIAHESNGNQSLSDEIQNAIKESLKDQESSVTEPVEIKPKSPVKLMSKRVNEPLGNFNTLIWTYFIVAKNKQRPVCLKFLLKTLNIDESRLEKVKKRILSGDELDRIPVTPTKSKLGGTWDIASQHLESLSTKPVPYCTMSPRHMYFVEPIDRRTLYYKFCRYHQIVTGSDIVPKLESYRRFLAVTSNIAFPRQKETTCAGCDIIKVPTEVRSTKLINPQLNSPEQRKRKKEDAQIKSPKAKSKECLQKCKKVKLKKPIKSSKRKITLRKSQRGDVFSLMLSHLKSLPAKISAACTLCEPHKYFSPDHTTVQSLYDDYRRYFLKLTNSELGLRFAIYESLFLRNPLFTIDHLDENSTKCPKCVSSVGK